MSITKISVNIPTYQELLNPIFLDPKTGNWTVPVMKYSLLPNHGPLFVRTDPLNRDREYQNKIIVYFYLKLTEKWLYKDDRYKMLHKYFEVKTDNNNGQVRLVAYDKINSSNKLTPAESKAVSRYIEQNFVSEKLVKKVLKEVINKYKLKWYDLTENNDAIKDIFFKRIKELIKIAIHSGDTN